MLIKQYVILGHRNYANYIVIESCTLFLAKISNIIRSSNKINNFLFKIVLFLIQMSLAAAYIAQYPSFVPKKSRGL